MLSGEIAHKNNPYYYYCHCFVDGLSYKCINVHRKIKLINHDSLPISMLLCIVLAYIMLVAALSNAVCLHDAYFLPLIFANAFCFHALSWFIDT